MNTTQRQPRFQRNQDLESLLRELNDRLALAERDLPGRFAKPSLPIVLVVGAPRSGTTLLMQWLAQTGAFAYPTNLLSRFFGAPYVGALVCQLIGDPRLNFGNELLDHSAGARPLQSELGKTRGMFEPNEFWYFWRRFFPIDQAEPLSEERLARVDVGGFLAGLASLQAVYQQPWAMKGILLQYNLRFLDSILDRVLFLHTERGLLDNARSLLQAREKYFGSTAEWFSVRPPGYEEMVQWSPAEQVVGQVHATNESIAEQARAIAAPRYLRVDYRAFCQDPARLYRQIHDKLAEQGHTLPADYHGAARFDAQVYDSADPQLEPLRAAIARRVKSSSS